MNGTILLTTVKSLEGATSIGYETGAVIAFLILVYLLYSLIKPEKF